MGLRLLSFILALGFFARGAGGAWEMLPVERPECAIEVAHDSTPLHARLDAGADCVFHPDCVLLKAVGAPAVEDLAETGGRLLASHAARAHDVALQADLERPVGDTSSEAFQRRFGGVPLSSLLVKPGHIVVRDPELVMRLGRLFAERPDEVNQTTGAIVLDLITDSAGRPARIEIREAHHRLFALHLADPNATIASLPSGEERLQWLVNGRIPGASEAEPSKVPVHGVLLSSLGEVGVHVSQKAATLKITATNWDLGARTSLGMAVRASLGELARGRSYGMALVEPELSDPARDVQLKWYSAEAERLGMTQIILVPSVPTSPVHLLRLAGAVAGFPRLNLYVGETDREHGWPGNFYGEIFRMRLQQLLATPAVSMISP